MIEEMYWDSFSDEYVLEKEQNAPPERYVLTVRGVPGIYQESWAGTKNGKSGFAMGVAYNEWEYNTDARNAKLTMMCEKENFRPTRLRYFTLPAEKFDEYVKLFDLDSEVSTCS